MDESTSQENHPQQQRKKTVRFACDETEVDDPSPSLLRPFLAFDTPTTSGTTKPQGPEKVVEPSLQMVPYVPRGLGQDSTATVENHDKHPRFSLFGQHNHQLLRASSVPRHVLVSEADPSRGVGSQLLRASSVPRHILVSEAGPSRGVGSDGPVFELGPVPPLVSLLSTRFRAFRLQIKRTRGASHTHTFVYLDDPRIRGP